MSAPIIVLITRADDMQDAPRIQSGVLKALSDTPGFLAIAPFRPGGASQAEETGRLIGQARPHGAILSPSVCEDPDLRASLRAAACQLVSISPDAQGEPPWLICSNDRQGASDAANYLIALGHRKIGFISISDESAAARERELGFLDALGSRDLGAELVVAAEDSADAAREAALLLLSVSPRPTAILASTDLQAAGVLQAARRRGISVPAELSVMGFGDGEQAAAMAPPLSTMRIPYAEMGFTAAIKLLDPTRADMQPVEFFCELVVRESTAPPP